jgi:hypothetical protein
MAATVAGELFLGKVAAERLRREIARARGNEVCFLAPVGDDGEVGEPRVVARGNAQAVLAAIRAPQPGGVVLHNHPSGVLEPSQADLAVAARLFDEGLGFAIIDNDATEMYVVVEPPAAVEQEPLDLDALEAELGPAGPVARAHPAFEDRPEQRALTRMIGERYNGGGIAIAEAGTGTGKSLAYLLPAVRWALKNRERTVVSTNTINLQEQLVSKDLPFLRRAIGEPFRFSLVKGRNNYVSIRRARLALEGAGSLIEDEKQQELSAIVQWLDTTQDGSLSDLPIRPSGEVWDEVQSDSDVCLRARCPHFQECFYQRARREAASADVLVVNHHLLFSDLAVRRAAGNFSAPAVLPHYRRLVLDEAHNLEEAATQHLGATTSRRALFRVLRRLENRGKGVLPTLQRALQGSSRDLLAQGALDLIEERADPRHPGRPRPRRERLWPPGAAAARVGWADDAHGALLRLAPGVGGGARGGTERTAGAPGRAAAGSGVAARAGFGRRGGPPRLRAPADGIARRGQAAGVGRCGAAAHPPPGRGGDRDGALAGASPRRARRRGERDPLRRAARPLHPAARNGAGADPHRDPDLGHPGHPLRLRLPPLPPRPRGRRGHRQGGDLSLAL